MKKDVEHRHSADRKKRAPADAGRYKDRKFFFDGIGRLKFWL